MSTKKPDLVTGLMQVLQNPEHPEYRELMAIGEGVKQGDYRAMLELIDAYERHGNSFADWHEYVKLHPPSSMVIGLLILQAVENYKSKRGKVAADALHSKPGGNRDKAERIRQLWASGNFKDRDTCAEQECAALEMSFSSARKALRNTPNPDPWPAMKNGNRW